MNILHLSYDYPDLIKPQKTPAVRNIIGALEDFSLGCCVSLNRTQRFWDLKTYIADNLVSLNTWGLPKGIFFTHTLKGSVRRVFSSGIPFDAFDLIHAHKLTFEGPIAYALHKKYGKPYVVSIQQTDFKVLKHKPLLRKYYYKIMESAGKIILISPWMYRQLPLYFASQKLDALCHKIVCIPLIVENRPVFNRDHNNKFLCAFHFRKDYIKLKNVYRLLKAVKLLKERGKPIFLDIAGDGPARKRIESMVGKLGVEDAVRLIGAVENASIVTFMSRYKAFVLCSYPETFGMVYVEALLAGLPVIHAKQAGIDGYFNDDQVGIAVKHDSIPDIAGALSEIDKNYGFYKEKVHVLQQSKKLDMFSKENVAGRYRLLLEAVPSPMRTTELI